MKGSAVDSLGKNWVLSRYIYNTKYIIFVWHTNIEMQFRKTDLNEKLCCTVSVYNNDRQSFIRRVGKFIVKNRPPKKRVVYLSNQNMPVLE